MTRWAVDESRPPFGQAHYHTRSHLMGKFTAYNYVLPSTLLVAKTTGISPPHRRFPVGWGGAGVDSHLLDKRIGEQLGEMVSRTRRVPIYQLSSYIYEG